MLPSTSSVLEMGSFRVTVVADGGRGVKGKVEGGGDAECKMQNANCKLQIEKRREERRRRGAPNAKCKMQTANRKLTGEEKNGAGGSAECRAQNAERKLRMEEKNGRGRRERRMQNANCKSQNAN